MSLVEPIEKAGPVEKTALPAKERLKGEKKKVDLLPEQARQQAHKLNTDSFTQQVFTERPPCVRLPSQHWACSSGLDPTAMPYWGLHCREKGGQWTHEPIKCAVIPGGDAGSERKPAISILGAG